MASKNKIQCVILAGGLAKRLRPLTETLPKALVPISGKPFLDYQLRFLAKCGVTDIVLALGYRGEMVREFAGDGSTWGLSIRYSDEGENLLGTGGALRLAFDQNLLLERFLALYGDSFLPVDIGKIWSEYSGSSLPALMTIYKNENRWDKSNVLYRDGTLLYQKQPTPELAARMNYIDYGLMGFCRDTIAGELRSGENSDLAELMHKLSVEKKVMALEVCERFYEIGSPAGLRDFELYSKTL